MINPNDIALKNGCFWGLDYSQDESEIILQSLPWDVTTSYRAGTRYGPSSILEASYQLDFYSPHLEEAWKMKIFTLPFPEKWLKESEALRTQAESYLQFLEKGKSSSEMDSILKFINQENNKFHSYSFEQTKKTLETGKKVITVGGDHSVSFGPIQAYAEKYSDLSILHFDAHADLREAYEGFDHSHASIMFNVMKLNNIQKLVQVGIRDISPGEISFIEANKKIKTYFDWNFKNDFFEGRHWKQRCDEIISHLSSHVYISFDIDALDPKLCPNTGTPVPGGLEFDQATYLIHKICQSGRKVVGADLVEVAPNRNRPDDQWDGNVGARMLFQLCIAV